MTLTTPPIPGPGLDPLTVLATGANAMPGVYALLLGSGVSTGAGVKTGWQVVIDLIRQAATAGAPDDPHAADRAAANPEDWWHQNGDGRPLGYSNLLERLGPTPAVRQALLGPYFEPTEEDSEAGRKVPSAAHKAIAKLVARGTVRVIITTNFDRLMERALEEVGIQPQVIHTPEQVKGITPLPHNKILVIKLHGDYADLQQRNTVDELEIYPSQYNELLDRILDEYGLIISGWSADWDHALVAAIERRGTRRYPFFWASYGELSGRAEQLVARTDATVLLGLSADELFTKLLDRLEALDAMAASPLTRDMAIAELKRALPDPLRRIELFDLLDREANQIVGYVNDTSNVPVYQDGPVTADDYGRWLDGMRKQSDTLLHLMAAGVFHDDGTHTTLWTRTLQTLTRARGRIDGGCYLDLDTYRNYPAHLALWVSGIAAIAANRQEVLADLLLIPKWRPWIGSTAPVPLVHALHPWQVFHEQALIDGMSRWNGPTWKYPRSHLVRAEVREPLRQLIPDESEYLEACDRFEAVAAALAMDTENPSGERSPWIGEYLGHHRTDSKGRNALVQFAEDPSVDMQALLIAGAFGGDSDRAGDAALAALKYIRDHRL